MNKALKVLCLYNGLFVFAANLLGPLYAIYVAKFTPGAFPVSFSWAVYMVSGTVFTYLISRMKEGLIPHEVMLSLGHVIRAVAWVLFIFVNSFPQLLFLQVIIGIGEAFGNPAFDAIFAEHLDKNKHIQEYADWKVVERLALALATVVGGYIVSVFGFPAMFALMAALALIPAVGILYKTKKGSTLLKV